MRKTNNARKLKRYMYAYLCVCIVILICLFVLTNKLLFNVLGLPNILNTFMVINGIDMFMNVAFIIVLLLALFIFFSAVSSILKKINKLEKKQ